MQPAAPTPVPTPLVTPVVPSALSAQGPTYIQVTTIATQAHPVELMTTLTSITNLLNTLTTQVNRFTETCSSNKGKGSVQLPKDYDSRDMKAARMFLSAF